MYTLIQFYKIGLLILCLTISFESYGQGCSLVGFNISANSGGPVKKDTTVCKNATLNLSANLPTLKQATSYTVTSIPYLNTLPCESSGSLVAGAGISLDDKYSSAISLGFDFCFYQQVFSSIVACDNGFITFSTNKAGLQGVSNVPFNGTTLPLSYTPTTTTYVPQNCIFGAMFDMLLDASYSPPGGGTITTQTVGAAPYRAFIIKYTDCRYYSTTCRSNAAVRCNMKIVLYETTNMIDIYINSKPICNGIQATQAIMGTNSSQVVVTPGRNNVTWDGGGTAYRFTPNGTNYSTSLQWSKNGTNLGTSSSQSITATDDSAFYVATSNISATCPSGSITVKDSIKVVALNNSNVILTKSDTLRCVDTITLNATNTGVVSYKWNNGATSSTQFVSGMGTYWVVRLYDQYGCRKDTLKFNLVKFSKPLIDSVQRIGCFNSSNSGQVKIFASGDTTGIQYGFNLGSLGLSNTFNSQGYGSKKYYVRNARQCVDSFSGFNDSLVSSYFKRNNYCVGDSSGVMRLTTTGGSSPYVFTLNGALAQSKDSFNKLTTGTYTIKVTDKNGCQISKLDSIKPTTTQSVSMVVDSVKCFGGSSGQVTGTLASSATPHTYSLNGASFVSSNVFTGLVAGFYTLRARDNVGCGVDTFFTVYQYPQILSTINGERTCPFTPNGKCTVTAVSGGSPGYTYQLNSGSFQAGNIFSGLNPGAYTITIKDAFNCSRSFMDTIRIHSKPDISISSFKNISCFGGSDGKLKASVVNGKSPFNYLWTNGSTLDSIVSLSPGSYCVTVIDSNSCRDTICQSITQPSDISISLTLYNPLCFNQTNGRIKVIGSGGVGPYAYSINGGAFGTIDSFTSLGATAHTIRVRDANLCVKVSNTALTNPSPLGVTFVRDSVSCFGGANGRIQLTGTGGVAPYQYAKSSPPFSLNNNFTGLSSAFHLMKIRDTNGCILDTTIQVFQYPDINVTVSIIDTIRCRNGSDGKISASATGGATPYTYSLNGGAFQTSPIFSNLGPGAYVVQIKDAKNCTKNASSITLNNPPGITTTLTIQKNVSCYGGNDGKARVSISGGGVPYTYLWKNGVTLDSNVSLSNGPQYVLVYDSKNCKDSTAFSITQPDSLRATISLYHPLCFNQLGSLKLNPVGGVSPYQFSINGGGFSAVDTFSGLTPTAHTVIVRDANLCTRTYNRTLVNPPQLIASYIRDSVKCFGGSDGQITINASGGTSPLIYKKNTVTQASNVFSGLTIGSYFVQVFDANNCRIDSNLVIAQYPQINISLTKTNINCYGASTGAINVLANGGKGGFTYSINSAAYVASSTFSGLPAGYYTLKAKDANNCIITSLDSLNQIDSIGYVIQKTDNKCFNDTLGKVKIIASGGTSPYQVSFNGSGYSSLDSFNLLPASIYNFSIKDNLSCIKNGTIQITQPTKIAITAIVDSVKCNKSVLGKIQLNTSGGTPSYNYSLNGNPFAALSIFSNLATGSYYIRIRDNNQCLRDTTISIYATDSFYYSVVLDSIPCFNLNNGKLTITGFGGRSPYQYNIDGSAFVSLPSFSSLSSTTHTFGIRDNYNCVLTGSFTLLNPPKLNVAIDSFRNNLCFGESNGNIYASANGGTGALSYKWSNGPTSLANLGIFAGSYTLSVTDSKNCLVTSSQSITSPNLLQVTLSKSELLCFGDQNASITSTITGGTPNYSYLWNTTSTSTSLTNLGIGNYLLTVTDANKCTVSASSSISQPDSLFFNLKATNSSCLESKNGSIEVINQAGGTLPYYYVWSNGQTAVSKISKLDPFTRHQVILTDKNGCRRVDSAYIDTAYVLRASLKYIAPKCPRELIDIQIIMSNGLSPFVYRIGSRVDSTTGIFNKIVADLFKISVIDNAGCSYTTIEDTRPLDTMLAKLENYVPKCETGNIWSSKFFVSGGKMPYIFNWPKATQTYGDSALHSVKGYYTAEVIDGNGCKIVKSFSLFPLDSALQGFVIRKKELRCFELPEGEIWSKAKGGNPPYRYRWSNGDSSSYISNLAAGQYRLTVLDRLNCKFEVIDSVSQPERLTYTYRMTDESCFNKRDGSILLFPKGGTAPNRKYLFSIGNAQFKDRGHFIDLASGLYRPSIKDENDCVSTDSLVVSEGHKVNIVLPYIYNVELNKTIQLNPILTVTPDTIQNMQYQWTPSIGLNCNDCLDPVFNGYADEEYKLSILHSGSCIDTATVRVRISNREGFYVPTAFMPSSDQADNKVFKAFGVNISKFYMRIYNRSGEKLFESNHISQGWDGIYKGELSRADSYYYYIAYETLDKIKHERKGDFILMR